MKKQQEEKKTQEFKYYTLQRILKTEADYYVIFGERSNGKTYSVLEYILSDYLRYKKQGAIIRRWDEDFKGATGPQQFADFVGDKLVKMSHGRFNAISYRNRIWSLCKVNEDGDLTDDPSEPFCYAFSISGQEHKKSTSFPGVKNILFDEFIARAYLPDEFVLFTSLLSTIIRLKDDVKIFMCGNTINKFNPYFQEMGLTKASTMKQGSIDVYSYGDSDLKVAVEYADGDVKNKKSNKYFAFNNPRLNMIRSGAWELDIYPHLPTHYLPSNILYHYYIQFEGTTLRANIVQVKDDVFTYIHRKTTPIKDADKFLVYSQDYNPNLNYRRRITVASTPLEKAISKFYAIDKVYYQDNEIGDIVYNYIQWCSTSKR